MWNEEFVEDLSHMNKESIMITPQISTAAKLTCIGIKKICETS